MRRTSFGVLGRAHPRPGPRSEVCATLSQQHWPTSTDPVYNDDHTYTTACSSVASPPQPTAPQTTRTRPKTPLGMWAARPGGAAAGSRCSPSSAPWCPPAPPLAPPTLRAAPRACLARGGKRYAARPQLQNLILSVYSVAQLEPHHGYSRDLGILPWLACAPPAPVEWHRRQY